MPTIPSLYQTGTFINASIFNVLATLAIIIRIKARRLIRTPLAADDWVIFASLAGLWIYLLNSTVGAAVGGVNTSKLGGKDAEIWFTKMSFAGGIIFSTTLALVKISILLFYMRIFDSILRFRVACYIMIGISSVWGATNIIVNFNINHPLWKLWDGTKEPQDINYNLFVNIYLCTGMALDVVILCMPLPVIRRLHMRTKQKVLVASIFWLGSFCCIASAVKYYYWYTGQGKYDVWQHVEVACSVIAACLPTYGPLVRETNWGKRFLRHMTAAYTALVSRRSTEERSAPSNAQPRGLAGNSRETDIQTLQPAQEQFTWQKSVGEHDAYAGVGDGGDGWDLERLPSDGVHVKQSVDVEYSATTPSQRSSK